MPRPSIHGKNPGQIRCEMTMRPVLSDVFTVSVLAFMQKMQDNFLARVKKSR